jgi:nitrate reductase beta subunit
MARVYNWQIGREMSYWYPESRPQRQFAAIFDTNKCIACQTCTLACKTTWTSGKGQEYMLWNNVETKPYGSYPLAWDLKLLELLNGGKWNGQRYEGETIFESAQAGERVLSWRPASEDYAYPNVGEDDCAGVVDGGAGFSVPHMAWFYYLARICNHCTYPACLASCPRGSIYKRPEDGIVLVDQGRCRGYQECVKGCPYKKVYFNPMTGTSEKCIGCFPKMEMGLQPQCFVNCIGKIRMAGYISKPENARPDNPLDYLVHVRKVALPLYPQFGLEPNVYYIPPVHVPPPFLRQMFGPGVDEAIRTYRNAVKDPDLAGLLGLFGSTESVMTRWRREGEQVVGMDDKGTPLVRVPLREPVHVRPAFDKLYQITRVNCP